MVNLKLLLCQGAFGSLQKIVNLLCRKEELGIGGVDDDSLGVDAQSVEQRHHGLEDLGHAAAGGGAVQVGHPQPAQFVGQGNQFVSLGRVHVGKVVVQ